MLFQELFGEAKTQTVCRLPDLCFFFQCLRFDSISEDFLDLLGQTAISLIINLCAFQPQVIEIDLLDFLWLDDFDRNGVSDALSNLVLVILLVLLCARIRAVGLCGTSCGQSGCTISTDTVWSWLILASCRLAAERKALLARLSTDLLEDHLITTWLFTWGISVW